MPAEGANADRDRGSRDGASFVSEGHQALRRADRPGGHRPRAARQRGDRLRGPIRVRQVDAARARGGPSGARRGRDPAPARRLHAPARPAAAVAGRARQRGARARMPGRRARRGAPAGGAAVRALRADRLRACPARRAVGRDAPAGRVPAHPAPGTARAAARRALRRPRRDHESGPARVAGGGAGRGSAHGPAGHARRRGGDLPRRQDRGAVAAARPGRGGLPGRRCRGRARSPTWPSPGSRRARWRR